MMEIITAVHEAVWHRAAYERCPLPRRILGVERTIRGHRGIDADDPSETSNMRLFEQTAAPGTRPRRHGPSGYGIRQAFRPEDYVFPEKISPIAINNCRCLGLIAS